MSEERQRVLRMLGEGTISAEEADDLLAALEDSAASPTQAAATATPPVEKPWEIPFFGGLIVAGLGAFGVRRDGGFLARLGAWTTFLLGAATAAVGFWSRTAPWLHVDVHERDGDRVKISLPLPFFLVGWLLDLARGFVDDETASQLDAFAGFIDDIQRGEGGAPYTVEIEDDDGDKVLIYLG
jgi:hypothetical protein